jgi:hypothetical protein
VNLDSDLRVLCQPRLQLANDVGDKLWHHARRAATEVEGFDRRSIGPPQVLVDLPVQRCAIVVIQPLPEDHFVVRTVQADALTERNVDIEIRAGPGRKRLIHGRPLELKGIVMVTDESVVDQPACESGRQAMAKRLRGNTGVDGKPPGRSMKLILQSFGK